MTAELRVYLLVAFCVERDGTRIVPKDWHTQQARQLFKLLLGERGRTVPADTLVDLLWPAYPDSAHKTQRSAISTLRTVVKPDHDPHTLSRFVPRSAAGYSLAFPPDVAVWIDAVEFVRWLDEAQRAHEEHNYPRHLQCLEAALQLYTGDYLEEDQGESWTVVERQRLRERYLQATIAAANVYLQAGRLSDVIAASRAALRFDACCEPLFRLIMQAQAADGDTVAALQTFERCRTLLAPLLPGLAQEHTAAAPAPTLSFEHAYGMLLASLVEVFAAIARHRPLVLAWNDIQWADEATLLVINRLIALEHVPLLLLLAYRPEDVSENLSLSIMLRAFRRRSHTTVLHLTRFSEAEVAEYLRRHQIAPPLSAAHLHAVTQGNALFLAEAVRTVLDQFPNDLGDAEPHPDRLLHNVLQSHQIRDVVLARVARLPQAARDLLELAAVIGRPFAPELLESPDLLEGQRVTHDQALEVLLTQRFLVERTIHDELSLAFDHDLIRHMVYANCASHCVTRLHHHVAEQVAQHAANPQPRAAEIAFHWGRAGMRFWPHVLRCEVQAGAYARRTFSYRQALVHYDAVLVAVPPAHHHDQHDDLDAWIEEAHAERWLVYEALLDWNGVQQCHQALIEWATAHEKPAVVGSSTHRMVLARSLMGHLAEAADMSAAFIGQLQTGTYVLATHADQTETDVTALLDLEQRWTSLLSVDTLYATNGHAADVVPSSQAFPPFQPAHRPAISNWDTTGETLGASAALTLVEYGWNMLLQGLNSDAEQCLHAALRAADTTDELHCSVLAAMLLSRVYDLAGQPAKSTTWLDRSLACSRDVPEGTWIGAWPLLTRAYSLIERDQVDEAEQVVKQIESLLARHYELLSYHGSLAVARGLLALARGNINCAEAVLLEALRERHSVYIEVYVAAVLALATIAHRHAQHDQARACCWKMLAFCGERSLLQSYSAAAFTLATFSTEAKHRQEIDSLLDALRPHLAAAQYANVYDQCWVLRTQH